MGYSNLGKIAIGIAGIEVSVALTVATGGAVLPSLILELKVTFGSAFRGVLIRGIYPNQFL